MSKPRGLHQRWLWGFTLVYGLYVLLPWLAPVLMRQGWVTPARWIYSAYALVCHQLPQRSYFLFGSQWMYSLEEIQAAYRSTTHPLVLRQFVGTPQMGWKVAWSDRMVSMYTTILVAVWVWWPQRHRWKPWPLWVVVLLMLPLAVDGSTHLLSDAWYGLGQGFRYTNDWLVRLTGGAFPDTFYRGDGLGSFNWWVRLISGVLFGIAMVGWIFPLWEDAAASSAAAKATRPEPHA